MGPPIRSHPGDDTLWDIGHGRAAVGPGWWAMVEAAFAEAEALGGTVARVRQKHCLLDVSVRSPAGMERSQELRARYGWRTGANGCPSGAGRRPRRPRTYYHGNADGH